MRSGIPVPQPQPVPLPAPAPPVFDDARVASLERALADERAAAGKLRETADEHARQLDEARTDSVAATTELELVQRRLRNAERALADKTRAVHDLATETELLKGKLRDADAQRWDYVEAGPGGRSGLLEEGGRAAREGSARRACRCPRGA